MVGKDLLRIIWINSGCRSQLAIEFYRLTETVNITEWSQNFSDRISPWIGGYGRLNYRTGLENLVLGLIGKI